MKASQLAKILSGELAGEDIEISGIKGYDEAEKEDITFVADPSLLSAPTDAGALILPKGVQPVEGKTCIFVSNPLEAAVKVATLFYREDWGTGISDKAVVYPNVKLGKNVVIREFAVVESGVCLEDGVVVLPFAYVGRNSVVGEGTILFPGAVVYPNTVVGKRCRIHAGAVVGADGFGYYEKNGKRVKIPQIGRVVIGNDVEIGANTCIDRATFGKTVIGEGTKIDNLVQIGHNCKIGRDCAFAGQVGISGSVKVGDRVLMGGQVGIADHISIGSDVKIAAKAGVMSDIKDGEAVIGAPAMPAARWKRIQAVINRLPEIYKLLKELKKRVGDVGSN